MTCSVFLLYGEEEYSKEKAYRELLSRFVDPATRDFNVNILDGRNLTAATLLETCETLPVMADKRVVAVEKFLWLQNSKAGNDGEKKEEAERDDLLLAEYLASPPSHLCLILVAGEAVDTRKKLYKVIESVGEVRKFSAVKSGDMAKHLTDILQQKNVTMRYDARQLLLERVGNDLRSLYNEVEKLLIAAQGQAEITKELVEALVARPLAENIFALMDAVSERQSDRGLALLADILAGGEPPVLVLNMLARQIRLLLQTKLLLDIGHPVSEVAGILKIPPFVAQKAASQCRRFTEQELIQALSAALETDRSIKTGKLSGSMALTLLIVKIGSTRNTK